MDINFFIVQFFNALFFASILFLISSGLSLIYGIMKILNLAHGALYMIGAYITFTVVILWLGLSWYSMVLGYLASIAVVAGLGILIERVLLKPLYNKPQDLQLLLTFALIFILDDIVKMIWGAQYRAFPKIPGWSIPVGDYQIPVYFIATVFIAVGVGLFLHWFFTKTTYGKMVRAISYSLETSAILGINTDRLFALSFALGAGLAGLAGGVAVPLYTASPGMGGDAIVLSFAVIVIGGMGSILGAFVGSLIVGFSRVFMTILFPVFEIALIYIIMAVILMFKPTGLFGMEMRERR